MKAFSKRLAILFIASLLIMCAGCNTDMKKYTRNWVGLTDGENSYSYLPAGYSYHGEMKKLVGYVDGGNAVYESDDGLFIKENESIFQSMVNKHLVRSERELPEPAQENCSAAVFCGAEEHALSEEAEDDLFLLLRLMQKSAEDKGFASGGLLLGGIQLCFREPEGLRYSNLWEVYLKDGRFYITDLDGKHALISESSRLCAEIGEYTSGGE